MPLSAVCVCLCLERLTSRFRKKNIKSVIGTEGLRRILDVLSQRGHAKVPTVAIGGLNASNVMQVMFRGSSPAKPLDGVAVVSAIVAAEDPEAASRQLLDLVRKSDLLNRAVVPKPSKSVASTKEGILKLVPEVIKAVHEKKPLSHNMTNLVSIPRPLLYAGEKMADRGNQVVQNFAANVALCIGASPIMANYGEEAADLAKLGGALVINMGTVTSEGLENYKKALRAYNAALRPVVFDPVG